jgi:hypothetical protein
VQLPDSGPEVGERGAEVQVTRTRRTVEHTSPSTSLARIAVMFGANVDDAEFVVPLPLAVRVWTGPTRRDRTMTTTVVRYQAKPELADENQRLIERVFVDLEEREPEGFTYKVFRLDDGVSFIHVVIEHEIDHPDSLQEVPAFQAFVNGISERCDVPPVAMGATIVGGYR